jgi:hypothetical protein
MLIEEITIGRSKKFNLSCDECMVLFVREKKYAIRKYHFCSRDCSNKSQKNGVLLTDFKNKCMEKYGCNYPMQSSEVRDASKKTCLEKYGTQNPGKLNFKNYAIKHGVENVSQLNTVKEKIKNTSLKRYGVEHPFASLEIIEKIKDSNFKKYGHEAYTQTEDFKLKSKATNLKNYGAEHTLQRSDIISSINWKNRAQKRHQTMKRLGLYNSSLCEDKFFKFLCENFDEDNVSRRITVDSHEIDFYISNINTYVQFDGIYWHGLDRSLEEISLLKNPRDKTILGTFKRDLLQAETFNSLGFILVRITDEDFNKVIRGILPQSFIIEKITKKEME